MLHFQESIQNNTVWVLVEDTEGNIWAGTEYGISKYNRKQNNFTNYDLATQFKQPDGIVRVFTLFQDSQNRLWAGTGGKGFLSYDKSSDQWNQAKYEQNSSKNGIDIGFAEDKDGGLWLGTSEFGLMLRSSDDSLYRAIPINKEIIDFTQEDNRITYLYADTLGVIWITTRNGVYKFNPKSDLIKVIVEYDYNMTNTWNHWNCIRQDHAGNIWIVNNYRGVLKFDGISDHFQEIPISNAYWLKGIGWNITLSNLLIDKSGIFWFGNMTQGLLKYDPEKKPFTLFTHDETNKNSLSHNGVFGILALESEPIDPRLQ